MCKKDIRETAFHTFEEQSTSQKESLWSRIGEQILLLPLWLAILAFAIWTFMRADQGGTTCTRSGCVSTFSAGLAFVTFAMLSVAAGLWHIYREIVPKRPRRAPKQETPYGTLAEYERQLRAMEVPVEQIEAELAKYRDAKS